MNPLNKLKELSGESQEDQIIETLYVIMKEFHYTIDQIRDLPIPTLNFLIKLLKKESDMNKKAMRKR
jgi:hypothetical protein